MNPYSQANSSYQNNSAMTAGPLELIIMLYDGSIKNLKLAKIHIEDKNIEATHNCLIKAQAIIDELITCLDMRYKIAQDLLNMYIFINDEIMQINIEKDINRIDPLILILEELKSAWKGIKGVETKSFLSV